MPLIYQGRLHNRTIRSLEQAHKLGSNSLAGVGNVARIDLRLAWNTPDGWLACAEHLPEDFDGYWIDVAAHADSGLLDTCIQWASEESGGFVSLVCLKNDMEAEVSLSLPGLDPARYDDQRYDQRFKHQVQGFKVRTLALTKPGLMSKERRIASMTRSEAAYSALDELVEDLRPNFQSWLMNTSPEADLRHLSEQAIAPKRWFSQLPSPPAPMPSNRLHIYPHILDRVVTGLSLEVDDSLEHAAQFAWQTWAGDLPKVDLLVLRCFGTKARLTDLVDQLDLYHFHPHKNDHQFGISTWHSSTPLSPETVSALSQDQAVNHRLTDWDIRWSGISFSVTGLSPQDLGSSDSSYVIRTAAAKTTDRLVVALDLDDPRDPTFRGIRRELASALGDTLSQQSAWEYDGPPTDSPAGRRYHRMMDDLKGCLKHTLDTAVELPPPPRRSLLSAFGFLAKGVQSTGFVETITDAIEQALPGFRYDRKAHITDRYYLEMVRRSPGGFHLLQIERTHQPSGFSVRLAATLVHIPFDDLDPGSGRSSPGFIVPLATIAPEREPHWQLGKGAMTERILDDFKTVLSLRARPFFESAEQVLLQYRDPRDEAQ